jgi:iron complex outermembrane receptor protein
MSLRPSGFTIASAIALGFGATPNAFAQDASADSQSLEEVIVTAQKRDEKLQNVPIAVSAFTSEQLQARGINNVNDLGSLAPNLQISTATGDNTGLQIAIRGGVQINPALYWDPTVGIYVDGVYVAKNLGSVFDVLDLQRVEVLRGPQGTLYGRNTLAGAVNFVTRQPSGQFRGSATVDFGRFNDRQGKFSVDLPKFGIVSISFGGRVEMRDGFPNTTPGSSARDLNNRDQKAARFAANLDFTDNFKAAYRFDYSDIDQRPLQSYLVRADLPFLAPYVTDQRPGTVSIDGPTFERSKVTGHALTLTWILNEANTLKSITAHRNLTWSDALDLDGSPLPVAHSARDSTFDNTSQEFQLVGSAGRFNYVAGLFYYRDDGETSNPQHFFFGTLNFDSHYGFGTRSYAAYGQVDYELTDTWTLTGGGRFTTEKKLITRRLGVNFQAGTPDIPLIPAGTAADDTFSAATPLVTLAHKFSDDINGYVKYSEGFKSGGFNGEYGDVGFTPAVLQNNINETKTPFKPERQKSVEIGLKTTLADGKLVVNSAVFQNKTSDLQLSIFRATGAASSVIRNAGKATTRGLELEAQWRPIERLRLQGSYGYLDGKYDEFIDRGVNVANDRAFVHAPKNTFNIVMDGRLARTLCGDLSLLADYTWTDEYYDYPFQLASSGPQYDPTAAIAGDTKIKAVGVLNMRLALSEIPAGSATAEIALWGRNVTDEKHIMNNIDFGPSFGNLTPAYYLDPRTYGIEATLRW